MIQLAVPPPDDIRGLQQITLQAPFLFDPGRDGLRQVFLLLAASVAGKSAATQSRKLEDLLQIVESESGRDPLDFGIAAAPASTWDIAMRMCGFGKYTILGNLVRALEERNKPDKLWHPDELQDVINLPGIGNKTSRFFMTYTSVTARHAVLDVHLKRHLGAMFPKVGEFVQAYGRNTMSDGEYHRVEKAYVRTCDELDILPFVLDFELWYRASNSEIQAWIARREPWIKAMQEMSARYRQAFQMTGAGGTTLGSGVKKRLQNRTGAGGTQCK